MSKLTGSEIVKQRELNNIVIEPFNEVNLNANSFNLTLSNKLKMLLGPQDMRLPSRYKDLVIPPHGLVLKPGKLYLGLTNEVAGSDKFVAELNGRSSVGRLGIFVHITAGTGDLGFIGNWVLEILVTEPTRVYPDVPFCQIMFDTVEGEIDHDYGKIGNYAGQNQIETSKLWKWFLK